MTAPPPTKITGFFAALIRSAAAFRSSSWIVLILGTTGWLFCGVNSHSSAVAFFVISTRTGPGRPSFAIKKALRIVFARSRTSFTMKLCFVIGIVMPWMSISWKESLPRRLMPTLQVIATTGTESM